MPKNPPNTSKNPSNSSQNAPNSSKNSKTSSEKKKELEEILGADDSLEDFKSPKQSSKVLPKNSVKVVKNDVKKRKKEPKSKKDENSRNQQSIPTFFAKAQEEGPTFICPLCLKAFSQADIQAIHMKNCAARNGVSTEKLLAALEMQERQGKERKAIGLPLKPMQTFVKKRTATRKPQVGM